MQLWFLSVLLNVLAGLVLIFSIGKDADELDVDSAAPAFFQNKMFRLVLGILMVLVALIKLGVTLPPRVPVIGDFFPVLAGIAGGAALLVDFYVNSSTLEIELPVFVQKFCIDDRKYIGIACIIVAVLHFIFPQVIFL